MTGTFLHFEYTDSFAYKTMGFKQLRLFDVDNVFTIERSDFYGK
jgi:hypothetical protein